MTQTVKICLQCKRPGFFHYAEKICWRREWQPTPDSCLENPMDRGTSMGYSPWDQKEVDRTERLTPTHRREDRAISWVILMPEECF